MRRTTLLTGTALFSMVVTGLLVAPSAGAWIWHPDQASSRTRIRTTLADPVSRQEALEDLHRSRQRGRKHPATPTGTRAPTRTGVPVPTRTRTGVPVPTRTRTARPTAVRPTTTADPTRTASPTATATRGTSTPTAGLGAVEQEVLDLTNAQRASHGCSALAVDTRLMTAARAHAADMVARDYFSHTSPDGSGPTERGNAAGYTGGVGENIAVGYPSAQAVMDGWMNSEGHRANILNCSYEVIGIGHDPGTVKSDWGPGAWVQDFGLTAQ